MKKFWTILLAVLLATGLVVIGCDSSGGGGGGEEPAEWLHAFVLADDGATFELILADNFEYGEGYQGQVGKVTTGGLPASKLFEGYAVTAGETYWLKATFKTSRDLEQGLYAGLVDTVSDSYWNPLSWPKNDDTDEGTLIAPSDKLSDADYVIPADTEISGLFKFVALKSAPSNAIAENVLNIQTKGEGTKGNSGSGVKKAVTLTFSEFIFAKGDEYPIALEAGATTTPPVITPPVTFSIDVGGTAQTVTVIDGKGGAEVAAIEGGYEFYQGNYGWDSYAYFQVDLGTGTLADYATITFTLLASSDTAADAAYKKVYLWANDGTSFSAANDGVDQAAGGPSVGGAENSNNYASAISTDITITIDATAAKTVTSDSNEPYLSIFMGTPGATLQITDVSLNK